MTILSINYLSGEMLRQIHLKVILPHEEMHEDRTTPPPWRTLYLLNGYTGNADYMIWTLDLERLSAAYGIAIVLPDGENSFYVNHAATHANYENLVARELVEVTRKLLPLSDRYEDTWIGGISMGGFGAMMLGMRHSDTFSKIVALSPACQVYGKVGSGFWPELLADIFGTEENYLENYDPTELMLKRHRDGGHMPELFMCCGTDDLIVYEVCCEMRDRLTAAGVPFVYSEGPGAHLPDYWNDVLPEAAAFLTGASRFRMQDEKGDRMI